MEWYKMGKTLGTVPVSQQWLWSVPHRLFLQNSPVLSGKIPSKQVTTLNKHDVPTKRLSVQSKQGLQWNNDYTEEFMKILLFSILWMDRKTNYEQIDLETHAQSFLSLLTISMSLEKEPRLWSFKETGSTPHEACLLSYSSRQYARGQKTSAWENRSLQKIFLDFPSASTFYSSAMRFVIGGASWHT